MSEQRAVQVMSDEMVTCRRCKRLILKSRAVYYNAKNEPCKTPKCPECYEDVVRHVAAASIGVRRSGPVKRSPVGVDTSYHGSGYRD